MVLEINKSDISYNFLTGDIPAKLKPYGNHVNAQPVITQERPILSSLPLQLRAPQRTSTLLYDDITERQVSGDQG
jgi:hypothetical protein